MKKIIIYLGLLSIFLHGCGSEFVIDIESGNTDWGKLEGPEISAMEEIPYGAILPSTSPEVADAFYSALSEINDPSVIVIIGENHTPTNGNSILTCMDCEFDTPEGDVDSSSGVVGKLIDAQIAQNNGEVFKAQASINNHVTLIAKHFPYTEIVPILLDDKAEVADLRRLVDGLSDYIPIGALIVGSSDFSLDTPETFAELHDWASYTSMKNFDFGNLYDLDIDSPSTIYTLLAVMEKAEYMKVQWLSDNIYAFSQGKKENTKGVSILSFGNTVEDESLTFQNNWAWDSEYNEKTDYTATKQLRDIKLERDKFLIGNDFYVFNLLNDTCREERQNEMVVNFCRFGDSSDYDEMVEIINAKAKDSDLVYLTYDFATTKEVTLEHDKFAKQLVSEGVDIFIGRGIEEIVPYDIYDGSLIFYSLGDFATNTKLFTGPSSKSEGVILGLYVATDYYYVYPYAIAVENGYPEFLDETLLQNFYRNFNEDVDRSFVVDSNDATGFMKIAR